MSDFHIVVIFNDYYTQIIAFFDQTYAEQKQKQTCCNPTKNLLYTTSGVVLQSLEIETKLPNTIKLFYVIEFK